jgi:hypothetical protein
VLENRVLKGISGVKWDKATGGWKKLHNEELFNKYIYNVLVKEDEMSNACSRSGENRNTYRLLMRVPEVRRRSGRPRCI